MNIVTVKTKPGENKYQLILRKLGCKSVAAAIAANGLENYEGDIWVKLESLAAQSVQGDRLRRNFGKLLNLLD